MILRYVVYVFDGCDNWVQHDVFDTPQAAAACAADLSADVDGELCADDEVQVHVEGWEPDYKGAAPEAV